jgi:hypothetical protein
MAAAATTVFCEKMNKPDYSIFREMNKPAAATAAYFYLTEYRSYSRTAQQCNSHFANY